MASDVAGLQPVISILEELHATEFWGQPDCEHLDYARGSFIGNIEGIACIADPDSAPFDAEAAADGRGVYVIDYDDGGTLTKATVPLDNTPAYEFYDYVYDANDTEVKVAEKGSVEYTRINDDWWFVWSYFD